MNLQDFFQNVPFVWFLIGLLFAVLELIIPGFVLIFFAFGAWLLALLGLFVDLDIALQIILFVLASLVSLVTLRKKLKSKFFQEGKETQSEDDEFTGQEVTVVETIVPGKGGKVEYKGVNWKAKSAVEIKEGMTARIIGKESINLIVEL